MADKKGITGWASNDGSFKRQQSSFRDVIEKGGKFEPEKGECGYVGVEECVGWAIRYRSGVIINTNVGSADRSTTVSGVRIAQGWARHLSSIRRIEGDQAS